MNFVRKFTLFDKNLGLLLLQITIHGKMQIMLVLKHFDWTDTDCHCRQQY